MCGKVVWRTLLYGELTRFVCLLFTDFSLTYLKLIVIHQLACPTCACCWVTVRADPIPDISQPAFCHKLPDCEWRICESNTGLYGKAKNREESKSFHWDSEGAEWKVRWHIRTVVYSSSFVGTVSFVEHILTRLLSHTQCWWRSNSSDCERPCEERNTGALPAECGVQLCVIASLSFLCIESLHITESWSADEVAVVSVIFRISEIGRSTQSSTDCLTETGWKFRMVRWSCSMLMSPRWGDTMYWWI